jgi:hypothetical protein
MAPERGCPSGKDAYLEKGMCWAPGWPLLCDMGISLRPAEGSWTEPSYEQGVTGTVCVLQSPQAVCGEQGGMGSIPQTGSAFLLGKSICMVDLHRTISRGTSGMDFSAATHCGCWLEFSEAAGDHRCHEGSSL